jgi:hypothetical protein
MPIEYVKGKLMEKIIAAKLGLEGGGCTIYARQTDGVWWFWQEGSSMDFDENDDEIWRSWSSEPVTDLIAALPGNVWWMMSIYRVHPQFAPQLRQAYDMYRDKSGWRDSQF